MRNQRWMAGLALVLAMGVAGASDDRDATSYTVGPTLTGAPTADLTKLMQRQGLLDPDKLTTWRSYSFGISTGAYGTTSAGLLVQHIQYQLAKPLTLYAEIGLLHNPLSVAGFNNGPQNASLIIPSLGLIYRPRENVIVSFHYSQTPTSAYRHGYGLGAPWWEDPSASGW